MYLQMDLTCPELEVITSDYGSRDTSVEEPNYDGFCGIESCLDSEGTSGNDFDKP